MLDNKNCRGTEPRAPADFFNDKAVTVQEIQRLDKKAIERIGIPSIVLMENAGRLVAEEIERLVKEKKKSFICVVCGPGNNGGDGFVAARYLRNRGKEVKVYFIGRASDLKADAAINYSILRKTKCTLLELTKMNVGFAQDVAQADVVVDAIFGVGLNREIRSPFKDFIHQINEKGRCVVAVDIPSGLDGTTGKIYGSCIKAAVTVTFSLPKRGFRENQGAFYAGKVIVKDIGIPKALLTEIF